MIREGVGQVGNPGVSVMDSELDIASGGALAGKPRRRFRVSVLTMLLLVLVLGCVFDLFTRLGRAVSGAREAACRARCTGNFAQLALALRNYYSDYHCLPPAYIADANGKPMHSWRVLILPYLDEKVLFDQYDFSEPWNGPNNIKLRDRMPAVFGCPSWHDPDNAPTVLTSYVAIRGPGTMFPGSTSTKFDDVTDGPSNTLMIVEVANVAIPWTAPLDLDVRTMSFRINDPRRPSISSMHPGGAAVTFGDGHTQFVRESSSPSNLKKRR